ncbi:MAG: radical SAM protein [Candidatus Gastranaerophilales bacterium]|nr:radical SAM protein [Candidatus Gastranaerophilales bacterium]
MELTHSKIFDIARDAYGAFNSSFLMEKRNKALMPLRYSLELTHLCNLNCPYCYVGCDRVKEELSTDEWLGVINQIPEYAFITLVGGEPLVRQDFCEILLDATSRVKGKVNVVTNGVLMDDKIIKTFIDSKMLLLSVSLDGWGENHDKNRGKEGIFAKITDNLSNLSNQCRQAKSNLMVDIKTIVLKDNLEDILKLYQYCTNNGFDYLSISFLRNNNLKQNSKLSTAFSEEFYKTEYPIESYFDMDKFEKIYLEINKMKKYSKTKIRFAPKFDNDNPEKEIELIKKFFGEYKDKKVTEIYKPCLYPFSNTIINPAGDVYPCLSYKLGNVKDEQLKAIINGTKYCCFRKNLKYAKVFTACQMCCELKVKDIK